MLPRFLLLLFVCAATATAQTIIPKHSRTFKRYDGCAFVGAQYADGDSFRVRLGADEFVFRLYYVDAPESDERFPDRNAEQARYFGITPEESLAAGKAAKEFVSRVLAGKDLTVFTRWASALGSSKLPRYYAVIQFDGTDLADLLVENGFARRHGTNVTHPDGTNLNDYVAKLGILERMARDAKAGAWATSKPQVETGEVTQPVEIFEIPRWLERTGFAGLGGTAVGAAWLFSLRTRKRPSSP